MRKKRVLIVNCFIDEFRVPIKRKLKFPQPVTPAFLAGVFSPDYCDIKLYNEVYSGPLEDEKLLSFPDMLVLTGLNSSFDRMLHLTAYARTKNKNVIVVAGGPIIRALYHYSTRFFDYCCTGDIEQIADVIEDAFGREYICEKFLEKGWAVPRYDLTYWMTHFGHAESSRNCCYSCDFCSLTGEKAKYKEYPIDYLRDQLTAMGKRMALAFVDNNFGGTNRQFLLDRFELLQEFKERGYFKRWVAITTNDFFKEDENLELARKSGCVNLFSGVESFDKDALISFKKYQNVRMPLPQVEIIRKCQDAGISFYYGLVFDVSTRPISEFKDELDFIVNNPDISLPCFLTLAIPLVGTPSFHQCLREKRFLPNIKLRDLDGTTLSLKPLGPMDETVQFIQDLQNLKGYRRKILRHSIKFFNRYKNKLSWWPMGQAMLCGPLLTAQKFATTGPETFKSFKNGYRKYERTFVGSTEPLDSFYSPAFRVDSRYEKYFKPTMLTDAQGNLSENLYMDLYPN